MKTADGSKQNLDASGQVAGKGKHLQAFAAATLEKVNSVCFKARCTASPAANL